MNPTGIPSTMEEFQAKMRRAVTKIPHPVCDFNDYMFNISIYWGFGSLPSVCLLRESLMKKVGGKKFEVDRNNL